MTVIFFLQVCIKLLNPPPVGVGSRISSREGDRNFEEENKDLKRKVWGRTSSCRELYTFLLLDNYFVQGEIRGTAGVEN